MNIPIRYIPYRMPVQVIVNLPTARAEISTELEDIANEAIQGLVEEVERLQQHLEESLIALTAMADAFSPDLYRVVAADAGRSGNADRAHALARRVLEKHAIKRTSGDETRYNE